MPELPEVETSRRGIEPHILGKRVERILIRQPRLRWLVPEQIQTLVGASIEQVSRRSKYLLLETDQGTALIHLGMSGSLRICSADSTPTKHDHVDIVFSHGKALRLRDPRRFGAVLYAEKGQLHPLLKTLGPEPLSESCSAEYLFKQSRGRKIAIKLFIMTAQIVVGVGNIYANEALFMAGIDPQRAAGSLSLQEYQHLNTAIRTVLVQAIKQGGTSLRDFVREDGQTGYFQVALQVYGRSNAACMQCGTPLKHIRQGQRSTWYCPACQI
ncbi:MAG: DNA-formamidopyrimidine glycosylase [Proteobacteria bacterium]|nr:MAG: DNA-formamidopyrimidine glycosylase [Pseudomonadota bacterium]